MFDVGEDGFLFNRRLFASVGVYDGSGPGLGIPDGVKVDTEGRVYTATVDGIQGEFLHNLRLAHHSTLGDANGSVCTCSMWTVFAQSGKPLGLIRQPGTANMGFAGKGLDTLYMLNDTSISYVQLQVTITSMNTSNICCDTFHL